MDKRLIAEGKIQTGGQTVKESEVSEMEAVSPSPNAGACWVKWDLLKLSRKG